MKKIILKTPPISVNKLYFGRRFLTQTGKNTKELMSWEAKEQYMDDVLECDIGLDIDFYVRNSRSDLDNLLKATIDCLTGILWVDDKQIIEILARKYIDQKNPRIEIIINQL